MFQQKKNYLVCALHSPASHRKYRKENFTIVELLVVITIIAILASMLLPALNKARQTAYSATCTNNLKQIGNCVQFYIDDSKEWIPPYRMGVDDCYTWSDLVNGKRGYVRSPNLLICKGNPLKAPIAGFYGSPEVPDASYSYALMLGVDISSPTYPMAKLSAVKNPSTLLILADAAQNQTSFQWMNRENALDDKMDGASTTRKARTIVYNPAAPFFSGCHNGRTSMLFLDLSCGSKKYRPDKLYYSSIFLWFPWQR